MGQAPNVDHLLSDLRAEFDALAEDSRARFSSIATRDIDKYDTMKPDLEAMFASRNAKIEDIYQRADELLKGNGIETQTPETDLYPTVFKGCFDRYTDMLLEVTAETKEYLKDWRAAQASAKRERPPLTLASHAGATPAITNSTGGSTGGKVELAARLQRVPRLVQRSDPKEMARIQRLAELAVERAREMGLGFDEAEGPGEALSREYVRRALEGRRKRAAEGEE